MTDKELMQQAFDAMSYGNADEREAARIALRERLAQPEQELVIDCPRWWESCPQSKPPTVHDMEVAAADGYQKGWDAAMLRNSLGKPMHPTLQKMWEDYFDKCYKREPEQEPVALVIDGVLVKSELPEKYTGHLYTAPPQRKPEQEPVAWEDVLGAIARGWTHDDNKHKPMDVQLAVAIAKEIQDMVIAPPKRKPLTDEEIERACVPLGAAMLSFTEVARAIEAAHGIKENT